MAKYSYKKEIAWIKKKKFNGVKLIDLKNGVGAWSNLSKEYVMKKDKLTEAQYNKKRRFLENVYFLLAKG